MRMLLAVAAVVATALAAGCTAGPSAPAHRPSSPSAAVRLTKTQACRQLLDDVTRHQGRSTVPGLRHIADHVTDVRMAGDARTAVRDIDHTGGAPVAFALLRDDCAHAGVRIPAP
jgi:hypothetical protein